MSRAFGPSPRRIAAARNSFSSIDTSRIDTSSYVIYKLHVFEVRQTEAFAAWLDALRDGRAKERIAQRIVRLEAGLFGDAKPVGEGISELRIDHGPGYRLYFVQLGKRLVILLCGGVKSSQTRDIRMAKAMAKALKE